MAQTLGFPITHMGLYWFPGICNCFRNTDYKSHGLLPQPLSHLDVGLMAQCLHCHCLNASIPFLFLLIFVIIASFTVGVIFSQDDLKGHIPGLHTDSLALAAEPQAGACITFQSIAYVTSPKCFPADHTGKLQLLPKECCYLPTLPTARIHHSQTTADVSVLQTWPC